MQLFDLFTSVQTQDCRLQASVKGPMLPVVSSRVLQAADACTSTPLRMLVDVVSAGKDMTDIMAAFVVGSSAKLMTIL